MDSESQPPSGELRRVEFLVDDNREAGLVVGYEQEGVGMRTRVALVVVVALLGTGLTTAKPRIKRKDAKEAVTLTTRLESTDLQDIAAKMVDSLLKHPLLAEGRPIVTMGRLTDNAKIGGAEIKGIQDKIRTALVQSGKIRFVASDMRNQILDENAYQESGLVNKQTASMSGNATGAQFIIGGEVVSIETQAGKLRDVYYKLTLNMVDLESQIIEWSDEKEIRKQKGGK